VKIIIFPFCGARAVQHERKAACESSSWSCLQKAEGSVTHLVAVLIRFSCGLGLDKWNQFWTGINERVIRAIFSPKPHKLSKKKNTAEYTQDLQGLDTKESIHIDDRKTSV